LLGASCLVCSGTIWSEQKALDRWIEDERLLYLWPIAWLLPILWLELLAYSSMRDGVTNLTEIRPLAKKTVPERVQKTG
jgi:hypothetical protein